MRILQQWNFLIIKLSYISKIRALLRLHNNLTESVNAFNELVKTKILITCGWYLENCIVLTIITEVYLIIQSIIC